jgi:hypothetical protein
VAQASSLRCGYPVGTRVSVRSAQLSPHAAWQPQRRDFRSYIVPDFLVEMASGQSSTTTAAWSSASVWGSSRRRMPCSSGNIHLVDVYAASKHPTAPGTRLEMWQESASQFPPCIPATPDELLVLLSKRADRTLSPRGIELGGMFYTSDADGPAFGIGQPQLGCRPRRRALQPVGLGPVLPGWALAGYTPESRRRNRRKR